MADNKTSILVDLGDAKSFANEKSLATKRVFGFTIANTGANTQKVILFPSYKPSDVNRVIRDGAIPYSAGAVDLNASSINDKTIAEILEFVKFHPTRIQYIQIESSNAAQVSQQMVIQQKSPFTNPESETITLSSFKSPTYQNDKMIIVEKANLQADIDTEMFLNVPAGASTTITFYCGGVWNDAESLYKVGVLSQGGQI